MTTNSYEKHHRLLKACDFSYLKVNSSMQSRPWIRAFFSSSRINSESTRIAFSVTKKVGKANVRNRVKRLLKESFRQSEYKFRGMDILFVVSPNLFKKVESKELAESYLLNSFKGLLKEVGKAHGDQ